MTIPEIHIRWECAACGIDETSKRTCRVVTHDDPEHDDAVLCMHCDDQPENETLIRQRWNAEKAGDPAWQGIGKRFFVVDEMGHVEDDVGVTHSVVARDIMHACHALGDLCIESAVKLVITEISREDAATSTTCDDEGRGRVALVAWPLGTVLSSEY